MPWPVPHRHATWLLVVLASGCWFGPAAPIHGQVLEVRRELDDTAVQGFIPDVSTAGFSVAIRATFLQPGRRGHGDGLGMVFFYGSGWFDGFRAVYDWNRYGLAFQIGREQEQSAIEVRSSGPVYPWVMHELVCVSDGQAMRLFVDGVAAGETAFAGKVAARNAPLSVGFGDFGIGSNRMYVEDLQFFPRALSADEVAKRFASLPRADRQRLDAMTSFMASRGAIDLDLTEDGFQALLSNTAVPAGLHAQMRAAFWQRLLMDGRGDNAAALLGQAARRLLAEGPRTEAPEARARIIEEAILLRAALPKAPEDAALDNAARDLEQTFADDLAFRSRLASATRAAAQRVQGLEQRALEAFRKATHASSDEARAIYLAPDGSDDAPGTRTKPVRTLQHALNMAKRLQQQPGGGRGVSIEVAAGDFPAEETVTLEHASGIRVRGRPRPRSIGARDGVDTSSPGADEVTRFTGAAVLHGWTPVSDPAVLERFDPAVRNDVLVCDLRAAGVRDWGRILPRGFGFSNPWVDVHVDGEPLTLARWPNRGEPELKIGEVVDDRSTFRYAGDRPDRWKVAADAADNDIWVSGMWQYEWASQTVKLRAIDRAKKLLDVTHENVRKDLEFHFLNVLEELDTPGEFFLDRTAGKLYLIPPHGSEAPRPEPGRIELSIFNGPFLRLTRCSDIVFEDLVFSGCRQDAIHLDGCRGVYLAGCDVRQVGATAVLVDGGAFCGLVDCDLSSLGGTGVRMSGGDRATLEPSGHIAHNCRVEDFGRIDRCYVPAFLTDGCGMVMTNNTVSRAPHHAFRLDGNDQYVARNDVSHVVEEFGDQAAIDIYCDPTFRGIVIEGNFFHDIGGPWATGGQGGVRLDDSISGVLVTGNVFHRSSTGPFGAVHVNGGKDNVFTNNVFLECERAFSFVAWDAKRFEAFAREKFPEFIGSDLYAQAYPFMAVLLDGHASRNFVIRNEAINCGRFQQQGDRNLYVGNRWRHVAGPPAGTATAPGVRQWIEQVSGVSLDGIGVQAAPPEGPGLER
jgi:hypothetical protein